MGVVCVSTSFLTAILKKSNSPGSITCWTNLRFQKRSILLLSRQKKRSNPLKVVILTQILSHRHRLCDFMRLEATTRNVNLRSEATFIDRYNHHVRIPQLHVEPKLLSTLPECLNLLEPQEGPVDLSGKGCR